MRICIGRKAMGGQELQALEQRVEKLLLYCEQLRREQKELLSRNEELDSRLREHERELAGLQEEREDIRVRVAGLIDRIDQAAAVPQGVAAVVAEQSAIPLDD
jgi:chromosome segregation ATPase